jgi:hypothetical protein
LHAAVTGPQAVRARAAFAQLARRDRALLEREPRQRRALAVLRKVGDAEELEQRVEVELHRLNADAQLGGQFAVRRRRREARRRQRPTERDEHAPLGRADPRWRVRRTGRARAAAADRGDVG